MAKHEPECVERLRRKLEVGCAVLVPSPSAPAFWKRSDVLQTIDEWLATTPPAEPTTVCASAEVVEAAATIRDTGDECLVADIQDLANVAGTAGDDETCEWFRAAAVLVGAAHDGCLGRPEPTVRAEVLKEVEAEKSVLRQERNTAAALASNGAWFWSESRENDLGGMSDNMTILVTAGNLRRIMAEGAAAERERLIGELAAFADELTDAGDVAGGGAVRAAAVNMRLLWRQQARALPDKSSEE